jgi:hypothetical protein
MLSEEDIPTYVSVAIAGTVFILVIDAYIKGIQTYVPIMLEMKR